MNPSLLVLIACVLTGAIAPAQQPVRRKETIALAVKYARFRWTPSAANAFHGWDRDGVRVDTPDAAFANPEGRPGWWKPGCVNVGVPYMWGGFSSLSEFREGIAHGRYAGDVYTREKRHLLENAVSRHAVGIDCSGLISRCWRLERSYSTRELPALCVPLGRYEELKPGDILNSHNNHVLLFEKFADKKHARIIAYEAGSPPTWKVLRDSISVPMLQSFGYKPWRYKYIVD
ncbi:MAG: hypothetical protein NTZ46_03030 [Verrucomicrobia bacterium]|nr:hypothetical protein [Verrucomicrobiota bacterium]